MQPKAVRYVQLIYHSINNLSIHNHGLFTRFVLPVGVSTAALLIMVTIVGVALTVRAKNVRTKSDQNDANIKAAVMLKRYSYESVKKMTNSFAHILKESKGYGEEFINELASMSRASHVNIIISWSNRAIIYEFMLNGSLDKAISKTMSTKMDWKVLYNIAFGVAHGLEYLHNSCVSMIVHFDIKPQNILMDEDLCPKVSDFCLAKLCRNKEKVSHKSDVYSYIMVVLETIRVKTMKNAGNSRSKNVSMYFPDWIYEDLERKETMSFSRDHLIEQEENGIEVVGMLEGSLKALQVTPKPLLTLPFATPWESVADSQETSSFSTLNSS
ncbi:hypothetical protein N665_0030s0171 [Sinapis alba]|nr:hypothetical protein N665_0030s0171 [Sinapis alba]